MKSDCSPKDTHIETKGCRWDFDCKTKKWNSLKNFNQNIMRERKRTGKALFLLAQKDTQNKHRDRGNEELILFFDKKRAYTYTFCVCVCVHVYIPGKSRDPTIGSWSSRHYTNEQQQKHSRKHTSPFPRHRHCQFLSFFLSL